MEKSKMDVFKERLESLFWIVQQIDKKESQDESFFYLKRLVYDIEEAYCDIATKLEG